MGSLVRTSSVGFSTTGPGETWARPAYSAKLVKARLAWATTSESPSPGAIILTTANRTQLFSSQSNVAITSAECK